MDDSSQPVAARSRAKQPPEEIADLYEDLRDDALKLLELLREWDEDNNGSTDMREFRKALPVLDLNVSRDEAEACFSWLLEASRMWQAQQINSSITLMGSGQYTDVSYRKRDRHDVARDLQAADELGDKGRTSPDRAAGSADVLHAPTTEIEHWMLFRMLSDEPGADLDVLESEAREYLASKETKHEEGMVGATPFWSRHGESKAKNRHALRKRKGPIKGWTSTADKDFSTTLRSETASADDDEDQPSRFLQGTVLSTSADKSIEEQLREALASNLVRVTELFKAWDDDGNGSVSRPEFRRAVALLGLRAERSDIDALFDSFDPDGDGTIVFSELNTLLRRTVKKAAEYKAPSLASGSKWGRGVAKTLLGAKMAVKKPPVQLLREAFARNSESVISMFKSWDVDGDQRITRREFVMSIPRLGLGEEFEAKDAEALFEELDRDKSGWLDYRELEKELRSGTRNVRSPEQRKLASKLLRRTDLVLVLGADTRAKKNFCARLAHTFGGSWLSAKSLAERELEAFDSRYAGAIRRVLAENKPLSTGMVRRLLETAVHGRHEGGQLEAMRGPFFLYDLPRSLKEFAQLEDRYGATPIALRFVQKDYEAETRFEESAAAAVQNEIATALRGRETRCVLELDGDVDTRDLVDRVVRFLSVEMRKRMLSRRADAAAQDAAVAVANAAQRDYLHAASHAMAFAIRRSHVQTARADMSRAREARRKYNEPSGLSELRQALRLRRQAELEHVLLDEGFPPPSLPSLPAAVLGGARHPHDDSMPLPKSASGASASRQPASARELGPPRPPHCEPRVDLQLSPRNWREPTPPGVPPGGTSLPGVRRIYGLARPPAFVQAGPLPRML